MTGQHAASDELQPTQVRRPWLATLRTALQAFIGAVVLLVTFLPPIIDAILAGTDLPPGFRAWLVLVSAGVAVVAGAVTRIMALPFVNEFLRRLGIGLPSTKVVGVTLDPLPVLTTGTAAEPGRPSTDVVMVKADGVNGDES